MVSRCRVCDSGEFCPTRCTSPNKKTHKRCKNHGKAGQRKGHAKCRYHGGAAGQVVRAAERRVEEEKAQDNALKAMLSYADLGGPTLPDVDPLDGLLTAVNVSSLMVRHLRMEVGKLGQLWAKDHLGDARAEVHVDLLERWTKVLGQLARAALEAGVQERQIRLAERQAELILQLVDGILEDLKLSPSQRKRVPGIVHRHLTLVAEAS